MQPGLVSLADTDDALFDRLVAINLKGTFNTLRIAANKLHDGGRIVNFSSSVTRLAFPGYSIYAATKAAVETMQQNVDLHRVLLLLAQRNTLFLKLMCVDSRCITPGPSSALGSDLLFL